jgi:hypothetical protein
VSTVIGLLAVFGWFWLILAVNDHLKAHAAAQQSLGRRWHMPNTPKSRRSDSNG